MNFKMKGYVGLKGRVVYAKSIDIHFFFDF